MKPNQKIKIATDIEGVRRSALWHLSRRDHSERELRDKLARKTENQQWIASIIQECIEYGYLDDDRFAQSLFRSMQNRGLGLKRISRDFINKGLDIERLEQLIQSSQFDYIASANEALNKKYKKHLASQYTKQQAMVFLQAKGHDFDDIYAAIELHNECFPLSDVNPLADAIALLAKRFRVEIIDKKQRDKALRLLASRSFRFDESKDAIAAFNQQFADE